MAETAIELVDGSEPAWIDTSRRLIREYGSSLGIDLSFQDFGRELDELPGEYRPPEGRLLLALVDGEPAGCAALRPLGGGRCELKRLYVRPAHRRLGLGRKLTEALVDAAGELGYRRMLLDTIPSMGAAHELYRSLGFRDRAPYRANPVPGATFLELDLDERS
jgi:putative acetyltransferase